MASSLLKPPLPAPSSAMDVMLPLRCLSRGTRPCRRRDQHEGQRAAGPHQDLLAPWTSSAPAGAAPPGSGSSGGAPGACAAAAPPGAGTALRVASGRRGARVPLAASRPRRICEARATADCGAEGVSRSSYSPVFGLSTHWSAGSMSSARPRPCASTVVRILRRGHAAPSPSKALGLVTAVRDRRTGLAAAPDRSHYPPSSASSDAGDKFHVPTTGQSAHFLGLLSGLRA